MSRTAVVLLCLMFTGPAPAQQPVPPPPVPVPPQPPAFVVPAVPARGLGGISAPRVVVAKVVDGSLVWTTNETVPVTRQIDIPVVENGQQVTRKVTVTSMQQGAREASVPLDGLKVRDAAGKKIQPLGLEIRLGQGKGVVLHTGPLPDEIRAMFKDDAVFVELPPGANGFAQPAFAPQFFPGTAAPPVRLVPPAVAPPPPPRPAPPPVAPPQPER